jgi:uncharacterized delta-60 repeat protein
MTTNYDFRKHILLFFLLSLSSFSFGQVSGSIDNTFLPEDRGSVAGVNSGSVVGNSSDASNIRSISTQEDGKIIISGTFYKYDNIITPRIARLNPIDGSLDNTFSTPNINNYLAFSTVTNDDKIIVCGEFTEISGISRNKIARLNSNGTLDTSFNIGTGFNSIVTKAIIQDDGKIVVIGSFTEFNGVSRNSIARLNSDGTLDTTFNIGTGVVYGIEQERIYDITMQNDGKFIITGSFLTFNGVPSWLIARINTNGSLDNTFVVSTGANYGPIRCVESQNDGKVIISGGFTSYNGISINQVARLNTDGSLDTTFNIGSGVTSANFTPEILDIVVQNDNKVILCGGLETINGITKNKIVRLNTDGSIDNSFNIGTGFLQNVDYDINWGMQSLKILNNGKIIVVGQCAFYNGIIRKSLAMLNSDGSLDNVFNASYGADSWVMDSKVLNDGKILISGGFNTYYQTPKSKIAKLNSNGTVDNSFNPPSNPNTFIRSFAIQNDNKIIITRNSSTFVNNIYAETGKIERLNSDGSIDNSFDTGVGANNVVSKVVLQNNKIYVIGNFTTYNGSNVNRVIRLNLDGSIDTSFIGSAPNLGVLDIIILNDSKILICGNFTSVNGITRSKIARLNSNGTLDTTFSGGGSSSSINSIALQSDGKIIFGTSPFGLGRLNVNGSNDSTFSVNTLGGLTIFKVVVQNDNKILAGGFRVGTSSEKRFFKYNSDGTNDTTFDTGIGITDGLVSTISLQTDGKIIVGGTFLSYGVSKDRIIRINNSIESLSTNTFSNKEYLFYPNPTNSIVHISATNEIINQINVYDMFGRLLKSKKGINDSEKINIQELPNAIYLLEVKTDKGTKTIKIIKQ